MTPKKFFWPPLPAAVEQEKDENEPDQAPDAPPLLPQLGQHLLHLHLAQTLLQDHGGDGEDVLGGHYRLKGLC